MIINKLFSHFNNPKSELLFMSNTISESLKVVAFQHSGYIM